MSLLTPALLGFLALIPIIIILYLIRAQRRREPFSSILLWRDMVHDLEIKTRFRRPPLSLLLLLQILVALLGALALARPFWREETPPARQIIVVLDASASMQATDVEPNRFAEAKRIARDLLSPVGDSVEGSVIKAGVHAEILAAGRDRSALLQAIDSAGPDDGAGDIATAWKLAGGVASVRPGAQNEVILLSDGSFPAASLAPIPAGQRFISVGRKGENQAIVQVGVRRPLSGSAKPSAFVRVANYSAVAADRRVRVLADGILFQEQPLRLDPRATVDLTFEPPIGTRLFAAVLVGRDLLAVDDRVDAIVPQPLERDALLVSSAPEVLLRALRAVPELAVRTIKPEEYKEPGPAVIVVFDGFLPPALPNAPLFVVNPPVGSALASARFGRPGFASQVNASSALVSGVDLTPAEFGRAAKLEVPSWAAPVVIGPDGPLILEGERDGRRAVVFGFDPAATNLPKLLAFPALVVNSVDWLLAGPEGATKPGVTVRLPGGLAGQLVGPSGQSSTADQLALYDSTERVGRYHLRPSRGDPVVVFAINLADERESDVSPQPFSPSGGQGRSMPPPLPAFAVPTVAPGGHPEGRDLWLLFAGLALATLAAEWWVFCRRGAS